jgi:hypothetical protein
LSYTTMATTQKSKITPDKYKKSKELDPLYHK